MDLPERQILDIHSGRLPGQIRNLFCSNLLTDFTLSDNTVPAPLDPAGFTRVVISTALSENADKLS